MDKPLDNQSWQPTPGSRFSRFLWLPARRGCTLRSATVCIQTQVDGHPHEKINAMKRTILSCALVLLWPVVDRPSARADFVVLTPPNPSEYGFAKPVFERGDSITALSTFSISSIGIEGAPSQSPLLFRANIYTANGLTRGPLLASASQSLAYAGQTFYDVPISFTFTGGLDYDIEIAWPTGGWNLTARFFRFDPIVLGSVPFDVGPVRVRDGNQGLNSDNWLLPNLRMEVVPEPSSLALAALGVSGALVCRGCGRGRAPAVPR